MAFQRTRPRRDRRGLQGRCRSRDRAAIRCRRRQHRRRFRADEHALACESAVRRRAGEEPALARGADARRGARPVRHHAADRNFLSRYGVYVVPSALKAKDPAAYLKLQQALLQARASLEFQSYIAKGQLEDLSIGKPGEDFESAFTADMVEIRKIK